MASQKRASKKYQTTRAGRFNNAARQQRFRNRQKQKVTHHCSLQTSPHDVLNKHLKTPKSSPLRPKQTKAIHCHHCGEICSPFLRHGFLRSRINRGRDTGVRSFIITLQYIRLKKINKIGSFIITSTLFLYGTTDWSDSIENK